MKVLSIKDQEDGSAIVELDLTEEEEHFFIENAIVDLLKKQLERMENEHGTNRSGE